MSLDSLEHDLADVLAAHEGRNLHTLAVIPHDLFERLRGKFAAVCGTRVMIADTRDDAERRAREAGWEQTEIISGPTRPHTPLAEKPAHA